MKINRQIKVLSASYKIQVNESELQRIKTKALTSFTMYDIMERLRNQK